MKHFHKSFHLVKLFVQLFDCVLGDCMARSTFRIAA